MINLNDMNITVMGLGRFGGGIGVISWLTSNFDCKLIVTDLATEQELEQSISQIADLIENHQVILHLGEHRDKDFSECDLVIANPAISQPWNNHYLQIARENDKRVTTEIRLLVESLPAQTKTIGVTGTAGKSTTTAMIHHIIKSTGRNVHLGGNIGGSLLGTEINAADIVVLELSSAMLYWLGQGTDTAFANGWSPDVGVITNLEPNHLDWHGELDHYYKCKLNIFCQRKCNENDICAFTSTQGKIEQLAQDLGKNIPGIHDCNINTGNAGKHSENFSKYKLLIPGLHNLQNATLAGCVAHYALGINYDQIVQSLSTFPGLPHRLQLVGIDSTDRRFFNDSKSTTPNATVLAVKAFANDINARIHLIAGGYDKGISLDAIVQLVCEKCLAGLYTIGTTGSDLIDKAQRLSASDNCILKYCGTLETAVSAAITNMRHNDILLLSPGCASWDQYVNFEERGKEFVNLVKRMTDIRNMQFL